jgi:hypothetical protein
LPTYLTKAVVLENQSGTSNIDLPQMSKTPKHSLFSRRDSAKPNSRNSLLLHAMQTEIYGQKGKRTQKVGSTFNIRASISKAKAPSPPKTLNGKHLLQQPPLFGKNTRTDS